MQRALWLLGLTILLVVAALPAGVLAQDEFVDPSGERTTEVEVSLVPAHKSVTPGEQVPVAIIFDIKPHWHIYANSDDPAKSAQLDSDNVITTKIAIRKVTGVKAGAIQWPRPKFIKLDPAATGKPKPYAVFEDRTIAYLPLLVDASASGEISIEIALEFTPCNDRTCLPGLRLDDPAGYRQIRIPVAAAAGVGREAADPADFVAFDSSVFADLAAGKVKDLVQFNVFGLTFSVNGASTGGLILLLLLAALGGFILNLTPCVLPVIPLKILGLSQSAGNPRRALLLGIVMSIGVVVFWLAIGGAIAFVSGFTAISSLFQTTWFAIVTGVAIAIFAAGMLGAFSTGLPNWVYSINPRHDTLGGSFGFGVMTAVLSTPCTAPFMATASAWAARQPAALTLVTFASIGLGMCLPYLLLSANPKWVSRVPRTGPASEVVKQVMGLLMLAVGAFFLGTGIAPLLRKTEADPPTLIYWWVVAAFVILAAAWLAYRTFRITRSSGRRIAWSVIALALAGTSTYVAVHFTDRGPIPWIYYTPERFAEAQKKNQTIVLDFTADWCLNCKTIEASVLHQKQIVAKLKQPGIVPMKVDLSGNNTAGKAKLAELKWVGIPLLAIFRPDTGFDNPTKFGDGYTPTMVEDAIDGKIGPSSKPNGAR